MNGIWRKSLTHPASVPNCELNENETTCLILGLDITTCEQSIKCSACSLSVKDILKVYNTTEHGTHTRTRAHNTHACTYSRCLFSNTRVF